MADNIIEGISCDLWDTLLFHAEGSDDVTERRARLLCARTQVDSNRAIAALRTRLPAESATTPTGAIGISILERTRLALRALGDDGHACEDLARELSEVSLDSHITTLPGATSALAQLPMPRVIVSNTRWTDGATLRRILDSVAPGLFQAAAFSDEAGWAKPDRRLFEHAWKDFNVTPTKTVHIGDRVTRDVEGARAFGARAIVCRVSRRKREAGDCSAHAILYDYLGLSALLELLRGDEPSSDWGLVAEGLPVWGPPVVGRVRILKNATTDVEPGCVLVLKNSAPEFVRFFGDAAAVLAEAGGYGSHAAQTAPLWDTPCVVGLDRVRMSLRNDDLVLVDCKTGRVLRHASE